MPKIEPSKKSRIVAEVEFPKHLRPLKVRARYIPPALRQELQKQASGRRSLDGDKFLDLYADEMFEGGSGLTRTVFDRLVEVPEESYPRVGDDGEIEFTSEIFAFLLRYAEPRDFEEEINVAIDLARKEYDAAKNA